MHAITISGYGRPTDVLHLDDIEEPGITDEQVLVRVRTASLNAADWHLIGGVPRISRLSVGLRRPGFDVPGSDFAGVVEAVGAAVESVAVGDEVYGTTFLAGFGALAEQVAVPADRLARKPANASFEEAAGVPLAATTALQALRDHGGLRAGQRVLVVGASGGVGTYAVQIAKHLGAEVTGVCSGRNVELVRSLGADHVVDYTAEDLIARADRYDLIVELAGTRSARQLRRLLDRRGTLVQLSGDSPNRWTGPLGRVVAGRLGALGSSQRVTTFTVRPNRGDLDLLTAMIEQGVLRTQVDDIVDLADVGAAVERLQQGHVRGKITVTVAATDPTDPADPAATGRADRIGT